MKSFIKEVKKHWQLYLLMIPPIVYLIIFQYLPIGGILIAFKEYDPVLGVLKSPNVGFVKFKMFFDSYYFFTTLKNTLLISLGSLVVNSIFPVILALLINEVPSKGFKKVVQTISYAPYFISLVVLVGMFNMFLSRTGFINDLLQSLFKTTVDFIGDPKYFRWIYILTGLWQGIGWWSIIYVGALSNVDSSLHEAATIDGASRLQRIWHINLPTIKPTFIVLLIMSFGSIMSVGFEKAYLMQNAANLEVSEVIATYSYKVSFLTVKDLSFGTAIGLFNTIINFILLIIANSVSKIVTKESLF